MLGALELEYDQFEHKKVDGKLETDQMDATEAQADRFLRDVFQSVPRKRPRLSQPHLTLTFAQSIDGKIAGEGGKQVAISGKESLKMTHVMRTAHTHIVVGSGTLLNDNPQLNARHLVRPPPVSLLPRPVILDSELRTPKDSKILANAQAGTGRRPLLIAYKHEADEEFDKRRDELINAGAEITCIQGSAEARNWSSTVEAIGGADKKAFLMVEGGATVISSLLKAHEAGLVSIDALIITIGKTMLGKDGVGYEGMSLDSFKHHRTEEFGQDTVIAFVGKD